MGSGTRGGVFAAEGNTYDSRGRQTHSLTAGDSNAVFGESSSKSKQGESGASVTRVNNKLHGASAGQAVTKNGGETLVFAESGDFNEKPTSTSDESNEKIGGSSGESHSFYSKSPDNSNDLAFLNNPNTNTPKDFDRSLGKVTYEPLRNKMMDKVIEEVHQPTLAPITDYSNDPHANRDSLLVALNGPEDDKHFIDNGGLFVGAGEAPRESEIQQVSVGNIYDGQPEEKDFSDDDKKDGLVGIVTYPKANAGVPPDQEDILSRVQPHTLPIPNNGELAEFYNDYLDPNVDGKMDEMFDDESEENLQPRPEVNAGTYQHERRFEEIDDHAITNRDLIPMEQPRAYNDNQNLHYLSDQTGNFPVVTNPIDRYPELNSQPKVDYWQSSRKQYNSQESSSNGNRNAFDTEEDTRDLYAMDNDGNVYQTNTNGLDLIKEPYLPLDERGTEINNIEEQYEYNPSNKFDDSDSGNNKNEFFVEHEALIPMDLPVSAPISPSNHGENNTKLIVPGAAGTNHYIEPSSPGKPRINVVTMGAGDQRRKHYEGIGVELKPGQTIPGSQGYRIPKGFRGRVIINPSENQRNNLVDHRYKLPNNGYQSKWAYEQSYQSYPSSNYNRISTGRYNYFPQKSAAYRKTTEDYRPQPLIGPQYSGRRDGQPTKRDGGVFYEYGDNFEPQYDEAAQSGRENTDKSWRSSWSSDAWNDENEFTYFDSGPKSKDCGYYRNECKGLSGPFQSVQVCTPKYVEVVCCC